MEVRNVQRTGKMHYVYLPTSWCRKYNISSDTKISITENSDGTILISPELRERKKKTIELTLPTELKDTLINLIMACYVNPTASFRIKMEKKVDIASLFNQKNIMSGLEFVELDGETVTYEAGISIREPDILLKTMLKKIKNLLFVMLENFNQELINKYEEEIDRSKLLIQKSVISSLGINEPTTLKPIDMYYTLQLAIELERLVDYIIQLDKSDKEYLKDIEPLVEMLKSLLENIEKLDYLKAAEFTKKALSLKEWQINSVKNANKLKIKKHFQNMAEIVLDWAITNKVGD